MTGSAIDGLHAGTYCVVMNDANQTCAVDTCFTLVAPPPIEITLAVGDVTTNGGNDGYIVSTVSGGAPPYSYQWSNGKTTSNIDLLTAGIYTLTVADANGCIAVNEAVVNEPTTTNCEIVLQDLQHPACASVPGTSGGYGYIIVSGAPAGVQFFYSWSNGMTGSAIDGLSSGTYCVTMYDATESCVIDACFTLEAPAPLQVTLSASDVTTPGGNDGYIISTVSGGTPPYTYQWDNGQTSSNIDLLTAGIYTVTVTDANGCSTVNEAQVNEPTTTNCEVVLQNLQHPTCAAIPGTTGGDGYIIVTGAPAGVQFFYSWSNGMTGSAIDGLGSGTYCVTMYDANESCVVDACFTLEAPAPIEIALSASDVTTPGGNDGYIISTVSGGTPPYTYQWSNGETSSATDNLAAGIYTVTVTDANGCTSVNEAQVDEPTTTNCEIVLVTLENPACAAEAGTASGDGFIIVSGAPAGVQFFYSWSNGMMGAAIDGLGAGTYCVTMYDATESCVIEECFTLEAPAPLQVALAASNVTTSGGNDGYIVSTVTGGTPPYNYQWNNGETSSNIDLLTAGIYTVTVTDANGCSTINEAQVNEPTGPNCEVLVLALQNPTCASVPGTTGGDGYIIVSAVPSEFAFFYTWSNGMTGSVIDGLGSGTYCVTIYDSNQSCEANACFTLEAPTPLQVALAPSDVTTPGGNDGYIISTVAGGTPPYTYQWSNGETSSATDNLAPGIYTLTVTDANGCSSVNEAEVNEPTGQCNWQVYCNSTPILCNGDLEGSVYAIVDGGIAGTSYNYLWQDANGTAVGENFVVGGLAAGTYTVLVTDPTGCVASCTTTVSQITDCCPMAYDVPGYEAGGAVYETVGDIFSSQVIVPGGEVIFSAGTEVDLGPGFEVELGAVFECVIEGCGN